MAQRLGDDGGYAQQEDNTYRYDPEKGRFSTNRGKSYSGRTTQGGHPTYQPRDSVHQETNYGYYRQPKDQWSGLSNVLFIFGGLVTVSIGLALI